MNHVEGGHGNMWCLLGGHHSIGCVHHSVMCVHDRVGCVHDSAVCVHDSVCS